jgi:catechol 2,3-dioxygenase-like lactoylglutathione lyase family enzyme
MTIELDHMGLSVSDFDRAKANYVAALKPLGGGVIMEFPYGTVGPFAMAGLGVAGKPFFWITTGEKTTPHLHVAFRAETRDQVDEFYAAAMQAGGTDNGAPGLRLHYHANYYGAFVLDPDGHNIEAVCHASLAEMNAAARVAAAPKRRKVAKKAAKAPAKKKVARKKAPAKKAAAKKPARKVARKAVRKPVGRGRKTKR